MDAADLLAAWWLAVEELFPAPQVVTMYQHSSRGVLEQSTASAIAAAENMHEKIGPTLTRFEGGYLDARLKELIKSYSGDDSKEFRQFLREKFKEDRPVLSTRLTELLAAVTPERVKKLGLNSAGWVKDVKEVRNKLAHTGAHVLRRGDTGKQLDRVNIETRALLTMLILGCIGADGSALDRAAGVLANNMKFSSN
ncbi:MAG: hypothetical protein JWM49_2024 [Microbacteriaceae bacterium]|nr:hypothetical protein [Microbacteriaceae bacterium]